ncbi:MAG: ribonuclease R [Burkholderiales bacterium]|nr:ribonuclease R [Burkholderiales bacterium]
MSTKRRRHGKSRDPYFEREAARYEEPIASREYILETLAAAGMPLDEDELARRLKIHRAHREPLARRIAAMERDGQVIRNRKDALLLPQKADLAAGRVEGHPDGYGFFLPDDGGESWHIAQREMRKALHGDRVMARPAGFDRRGRREGAIVEVIEPAHQTLVGRLSQEAGFLVFTPAERRIGQEVLVAAREARGAKAGQVVVVRLLSRPSPEAVDAGHPAPLAGRVEEVLGNVADPGIEIEVALRKHELPFEFSPQARAQATRLPAAVRKADAQGREDLRALPLATIDGETAKDFDDAVYCEAAGRGWRLLVAIADVSHDVPDGDALDADARDRGTSVYFPRRVIPMLPERLSNGLCSLNPEVDRLCVACDMSVSAAGAVRGYRFYPAVMRSRARLTYTAVAQALAEPAGRAARAIAPLMEPLARLREVYAALARARKRRGAIDFETVETRFAFDEHGHLARIERVERNDAHRLIEECMLAANVCASDFLRGREHPVLYRVHEGPTPEKLEALKGFLKSFGLALGGGAEPRALDYAKLLDSVRDRPDVQLLQTVLLRSLRQALYSPENAGHFGLAYESYTHFTSPIRRYPDLLAHRAIKAALAGESYRPGNWQDLGRRCSEAERRADEATRDVEAWLKCYYMKDRVGGTFEGSISAVTGFGIFVALDDLYVEGLVHVSELGSDYFHFDATRHELSGERTRRRFRLADRVRIRVARVDLESSRMDFVLA